MHPEREPRVTGLVGTAFRKRASDVAVERVQAPDLAVRLRRRPEHDPEVRAQGAGEPRPGVGAEVGVVEDGGGDGRVCDLEQERPRAGAEEEKRLAVEAPGDGVRAEEARIHLGQRSPGRRPTTHQAAGKAAAARAIFSASPARNGVRPFAIAHSAGCCATTASHGTPTA